MNKITKYLSMAVLGVCCCACTLDSESMVQSNEQNSYRTAADAEAAIVGCYSAYRTTAGYGNMPIQLVAEVMGDDCFGATGTGDDGRYQLIDRFTRGSLDNLFALSWNNYYFAIGRCNTLLSKIPGMELTEEELGNYEGEARFLRAMCYFELVRLFGNIPLITVPTAEFTPQANPDEVYAQIVDDLVHAANSITYAADKGWYLINDGRATAEAAKAMLGRVYLYYTGYYEKDALPTVEGLQSATKEEVIAALNDVVTGGKFGLVKSRYSDLWAPACYGNAETIASSALTNKPGYTWVGEGCMNADVNEFIFTQKFNYQSDCGNGFITMVGFRDAGNKAFIPYGKGWGGCTVNPAVRSCFEAGDERLSASVIDLAGEGLAETFATECISQQKEYTGYALKKYAPLSIYDASSDTAAPETDQYVGADFQYAQGRDYVIMRYADVLMMLDELNGNMVYINSEIRPRAGLTTQLSYSPENILQERRREFLGEGIRYWDVLRQGVTAASQILSGTFSVQDGLTPTQFSISAENVVLTRGLCQIPQEQIGLSGNRYVQNQGW